MATENQPKKIDPCEREGGKRREGLTEFPPARTDVRRSPIGKRERKKRKGPALLCHHACWGKGKGFVSYLSTRKGGEKKKKREGEVLHFFPWTKKIAILSGKKKGVRISLGPWKKGGWHGKGKKEKTGQDGYGCRSEGEVVYTTPSFHIKERGSLGAFFLTGPGGGRKPIFRVPQRKRSF